MHHSAPKIKVWSKQRVFCAPRNQYLFQRVGKNKVRKEIEKNRKQFREKSFVHKKRIKRLYFDGGKDQTLEYLDGKRTVKSEEHIALVEEPENKYFGHLSSVPPVKAVNLANGIIIFFTTT